MKFKKITMFSVACISTLLPIVSLSCENKKDTSKTVDYINLEIRKNANIDNLTINDIIIPSDLNIDIQSLVIQKKLSKNIIIISGNFKNSNKTFISETFVDFSIDNSEIEKLLNEANEEVIKLQNTELKNILLESLKSIKLLLQIRINQQIKENLKFRIKEIIKQIKTSNVNDPEEPHNPSNPSVVKPTNSNLVYDNSNYYAELNGLRGEQLFIKLSELQRRYKNGIQGYNDLYRVYRSAFVDKYFEKDNTLLDIYSENPNGKDPYVFSWNQNNGGYHGEGDMYNREHIIPQSWFNRAQPTRNDAHMVWPTDGKVNALRSNYPHYYVTHPTHTSLNGTKVDGTYAEPIDVFKGDIARVYFYFQITHKNAQSGHASEVFKSTYPYFNDKFLKTYLDWSKNDPIDQFDIDRNNAIANEYGGLRNPFSDYPNLPYLIWGNTNDTFVNHGVAIGIN
ncbi:endonuclease [Mycoplasmopsis lipofaciens]|uniref:endonuclease n=1 Tax=Mycoplasmopsis lipofaciens TaxID=114884 RepID=UPI000486D7CD|nr:endonuclease [Mycoplasmopsis lipofaciens]